MKMLSRLIYLLPALAWGIPTVERMSPEDARMIAHYWYVSAPAYKVVMAGYTGSMKPYIMGGEYVLIETGVEPKIGDLVIIRRWDKPVMHELIDIRVDRSLGKPVIRYLTKGTNCFRADGWYNVDKVRGVARRVIRFK